LDDDERRFRANRVVARESHAIAHYGGSCSMKKNRCAPPHFAQPGDTVPRRFGLEPPDIFHSLMRYERLRCDREGGEFSLAVFDTSGLDPRSAPLRRVAEQIRRAMRSIDVAGWLDATSIGALLPVTGVEGGKRFASRIGCSIPCTVYTYPGAWAPVSSTESSTGDRSSAAGRFVDSVLGTKTPAWKAVTDFAGSLLLIVILLPLLLALAAYIRLISRGPILYRQERVGYRGRTFTLYKFRTMYQDSDPGAHQQHLKDLIRSGQPMEKLDRGRDPRIMPGGRLIRKACLDELPQLFNVVRREMSLVGPRPCIPYEAQEYLRWHAHRFDCRPGMTGLWQVSGKNRLTFEQMVRLDIAYADRLSLLLDLKILAMTIPSILGMSIDPGQSTSNAAAPRAAPAGILVADEGRALRDS
jgi:lipopolysaccharide/colanic/teichoic acid biosynthesis glycosyltransferase